MARRVLLSVALAACLLGVVAYQSTRPERAPAGPVVFVPEPQTYLDFSPSFRTSIADVYYLQMVQYYGEHAKTDGRLNSLPEMVRLVTSLSPHFARGYFFGAFALIDAGRPDVSYEILQQGFAANPDDYRFPAYLGFFMYTYGEGAGKDAAAGEWYRQAAEVPGRPEYIVRLAALLLDQGGDEEKSIAMWGQVYLAGDKFSRQKAVDGLEKILPDDKEARMKALAPLVGTMPQDQLNALIAELFGDS